MNNKDLKILEALIQSNGICSPINLGFRLGFRLSCNECPI